MGQNIHENEEFFHNILEAMGECVLVENGIKSLVISFNHWNRCSIDELSDIIKEGKDQGCKYIRMLKV